MVDCLEWFSAIQSAWLDLTGMHEWLTPRTKFFRNCLLRDHQLKIDDQLIFLLGLPSFLLSLHILSHIEEFGQHLANKSRVTDRQWSAVFQSHLFQV